MKRCPSCNVYVNTDRKTCPLCYDVLKDIDKIELDNPIYPNYVPTKKKSNLFLKTVIFVCLLTILSTLIIDLATHKDGEDYWFPYVAISMVYVYILIKNSIMSKHNTAYRVVVQMLALSLMTFLIDYFSQSNGWSYNYVIPLLSVVSSFVIVIVALVKKGKYSEYIFCLISSLIIGVIPLILWTFKLVTALWPSLVAACFSLMVFLGMLIFADKATKEEFNKRFHI